MALQLLSHPKLQNGKRYVYYSVAEGFRSDGKSKKRVLAHLGRLSDEQAEAIRTALKLRASSEYQLVRLAQIECEKTLDYLPVAVFDRLWQEVGIENILSPGRGDIELSKLLEILVLNRCCQPKSKLGVTRWLQQTALPGLLNCSSSIEETRLYRSLETIEAHHEKVERHLFDTLIGPTTIPASLYFYDLSTSYFEGEGVTLAAHSEHSKDHRPDRLQVVLGLLLNEKGLPFSWDLFRGNQGEAPTLKGQIKKFQERFHIQQAVCVFDRGFLSQDNLELVEEAGYHYVTGLDAPQIETLLALTKQDWLYEMNADTCEEIVSKQKAWHRFDDTQFYSPVGVINDRQTILLFDIARYRLALFRRQEKIDTFKAWVVKHNEWLTGFKKDADRTAIERDVETELAKRHLTPYVTVALHEVATKNQTFIRRKNNPFPSQGHSRKVRSFQLVVQEKNHHPLDGVFALITSNTSPLGPSEMIHAYRQKYLIEAAFREMKSVLKLRPWFVYKEEHVRAHYTICVLAYLLERLLDLKLDEHHLKEQGWTLPRLKEEMALVHLAQLNIAGTRRSILQNVPADLAAALSKMGLKSTLSPKLSTAWNR